MVMEAQLQALYERAIPESMPPEVFADLAMRIVNQEVKELRQEIFRLQQVIAVQTALLNPMAVA